MGLLALLLPCIGAGRVAAVESLCAEVKIEIVQELTLERQAFDAHMRINNGLESITLENIDIAITFENAAGQSVLASSNPNDTNALFYIAMDAMENIANIGGSGTVAPQTSADIHWLIIPAPGAGERRAEGTLYKVGAVLSYSYSGRDEQIVVNPDSIYVKPMPRLYLDYFLPDQVYGDDAFTGPIEPPVPFSLGLRVGNPGYGWARNLAIDSSQPKIIENELGLLIGFTITGSEVDGRPSPETLSVDFGDLRPGGYTVACWTMECSLSGEFTEFTNRFSHSDELGGELTSLIGDVRTHLMLSDVMVDLPGRDSVRDFLAEDGAVLRVYESEGGEAAVSNVSGVASFELVSGNGTELTFRLWAPPVAGPLYARMDYDKVDEAHIVSVVRADGKRLKAANTWFSKTREKGTDPWEHAFNLFDVNGGGTYTIVISDESAVPRPPVLAHIGDRVTSVGEPLGLGFLVEASDPDGTIPALSVSALPTGAEFTTTNLPDYVEGTFFWRPQEGQEGVYPIRFVASDGELTDDETVRIYVGAEGETTNAAGIPESLVDWYVRVTNVVVAATGGEARVYWDGVEGVEYDIFSADAWFGAAVPWQRVTNVIAASNAASYTDRTISPPMTVRLYHVTLPDDAVPTNRPWGVALFVVAPGSLVLARPLRIDGRLDGEFGALLAQAMSGDDGGPADGVGDELFLLRPDGRWAVHYLDAAGQWRDGDGLPSDTALADGEGLILERNDETGVVVVLAGAVGNDGTREAVVNPGWNLVSLCEGETMALSTALGDCVGEPVGAAVADHADLIVYEDSGGTLRTLMYVSGWGSRYEGKWVEVGTTTIRDPQLVPGKVLYYRRVSGAGELRIRF